jgi:hypothetical protein
MLQVIKKPARGGLGEAMENFMWYKAGGLILLAVIYNFWIGFRDGPQQPPSQSGEQPGRPEARAAAQEHSGRR